MELIIRILNALAEFLSRLFKPYQPDPLPEPKPQKPTIIQDFIPVGRGNRPGYAMTPLYITIHDTGNPNLSANAKAHAGYVKGDTAAGLPVSWHFTVDDSIIYQHLPLDENGWHAGDGNGQGNRASIGIEICENADGDRAKAEYNAALLVAWLHSEVASLLAFPSSMKQHYDWSGKNCPRVIRSRPNGWQQFLNSIPLKQHSRTRAQ